MISVIGGTYREIDYDDISMEIFGSGFRASKYLLENNCPVHFFTSGTQETFNFLRENRKVYQDFEFELFDSDELITFKYCFALDEPAIFPSLLNISKTKEMEINEDNVIAFGMLETDYQINSKKVVYDPQTSLNPTEFKNFGKADELIYIVNMNEAKSISSSNNIEDIKSYFFEVEKVKAFIIKNGPYGASLFYKKKEITIPSYITNNVNKIGSGDIFTASFGYYWMKKKLSLKDSAINASKTTAYFCDKNVLIDCTNISDFEYKEFKSCNLSDKQIYLASPFFALSELILIDKIRTAFLSFGVNVFSPFHDIGLGDNISIAKKDIEGIKKSDIIFCVFDNYDTGTLIESGYSLSNEKKMIGYHRTCDDSKLLMLKPGDIKIYKNLTTAIYQTIWSL